MVIIGGGVAGMCTAWYLAERGVSVAVCEKGRIAGEQSSRNWGWIRAQGRDADELPIAIESVNAWEQIAGVLDTDIGYTRGGVMYLADTEADLAALESWLALARQHQLDSRLLSSAQVDAHIDGPPGQFAGALFTPSDARAEPFEAVPALARHLHRRGVSVSENCAVRALDLEAGRVTGVVTEHGRVRAQAVLLAGGAWSSLFLGNLGITLPQLTVRATVARTASAPDVFNGCAASSDVALRRRHDGGYTIAGGPNNEHFIGRDSVRFLREFLPALRGARKSVHLRWRGDPMRRRPRRWQADETSPFEHTRVLNPPPSQAALEHLRARVNARLPKLAAVPFVESWAGMIDTLPDVVPVMDAIGTCPGLYVATGFSGHGFGFGPGAGRVMADLITGRPAAHDLTRFRFDRFSDGTAMRPGPGL